MKVNKDVLGLLNPVSYANKKYLSLQRASKELIRDVTVGGEFSDAYHLLEPREEKHDGQKNRNDANDAKLKGLVRELSNTNRRLILRAKIIGAWLNVRGNTVTGTLFAAT